jgi:hypothetical protein
MCHCLTPCVWLQARPSSRGSLQAWEETSQPHLPPPATIRTAQRPAGEGAMPACSWMRAKCARSVASPSLETPGVGLQGEGACVPAAMAILSPTLHVIYVKHGASFKRNWCGAASLVCRGSVPPSPPKRSSRLAALASAQNTLSANSSQDHQQPLGNQKQQQEVAGEAAQSGQQFSTKLHLPPVGQQGNNQPGQHCAAFQ